MTLSGSGPVGGPTPVVLLTGFVGSGKTTLLTRMLDEAKRAGLRPAVLMNEIGQVSLDGALVQEEVPMTELMDGCICCSVRGELVGAIQSLIEEHKPDLLFVEATGLANPIEIVEAITDTSLFLNTELRSLITVIGADQFYGMLFGSHASRISRSTLHLLEDQVRVANRIVLNKVELLQPDELYLVKEKLRQWNDKALLQPASYSSVPVEDWIVSFTEAGKGEPQPGIPAQTRSDREEGEPRSLPHEHITVFTHQLEGPVKRKNFQQFMASLPPEVYRAKGLVTFQGEDSGEARHLMQYAYRELSLTKLLPRKKIPDVLVVMGEGISLAKLRQLVLQLEERLPGAARGRSGLRVGARQ
ncbi:GTP-binding protein [Gorillibacterium sp. CAU 1737]|uniref:CobW family GTP-binding protein n=1 Tax=Gorillibacterium sp. CAU 1737 TaxID=3140362 RepID=UPI00325FEF86